MIKDLNPKSIVVNPEGGYDKHKERPKKSVREPGQNQSDKEAVTAA